MNKEKQSINYAKNTNIYVYKLIQKNKKILDVGCNRGNLGKKLIKEKNCKVWGIDYSLSAIKIAKKRLTKAKFFDLEEYKNPYKSEKFDIIIFADILEHLRYPKKILKNFSDMLKKDGSVIASIPNVANIRIRTKLLFGNWDYTENGILDRTHLRFFTKKTIKELFKLSNYKIIKIDSTPGLKFQSLLFSNKINNCLKKIDRSICKIFPKVFASQFIIIAKKEEIKTIN